MKKSLLAIALATTIIGSIGLAGCSKNGSENNDGGQKSAAPKVTNLKMTVYGSENDQKVYRERLDAAQKVFPDIKVELVYIPDQYDQKLLTMIASGNSLPDIIQVSESVHSFSAKGQLAALDELVSKNGIKMDERFGSAHQVYNYKGKLYAMPDRGGAMLLYYNKDMFDKAGLKYPSKDWKWSDFLNAAQKLTVKNGKTTDVYGFAAGDWWPWWMSFIYQNGGRILDKDNNVVVNSPETIEALQFYNDLVYKYGVAPSPVDYGNLGTNSPDPLFAKGKAAMELTGFWNIGSLNSVKDFKWDVAPIWGQKERATTAFGSGFAITEGSKNKEAAFKIINYLTDVDGQMPIITSKEDAPANKKVLGSDAFLKAQFAANPINMQAFSDSSDAIMQLPLGPWWNELTQISGNHLSELFSNKKDVKTVAKEWDADLKAVMKKY